MSDGTTLVKNQTEKLDDFNKRLSQSCEEAAVTAADVHIVSPGMAVMLLAGVVLDEKTKEPVPAGPQIRIQLAAMEFNETVKGFNTRLGIECGSRDITSAELHLLDGMPVVALYEEAIPDEKNPDELVPVDRPVQVRVCRIGTKTPDEALKTEQYMEKIFAAAAGAVVDIRVLEDHGKAFCMVTYIEAPTDDEDIPEVEAELVGEEET